MQRGDEHSWQESYEDTVLSVLKNNMSLHCQIYEENFYNSVKLSENLLHGKTSLWCH
jgi:hypothetical protein